MKRVYELQDGNHMKRILPAYKATGVSAKILQPGEIRYCSECGEALYQGDYGYYFKGEDPEQFIYCSSAHATKGT